VEIEQAADGLVKVSRPGQVVARAAHSLGEMLAGIRPVAENFIHELSGMTEAPEQIGLEFGLSLSADANLIVAAAAATATFKVSLTWRRPVVGEDPGSAGSSSVGQAR
jgi:hypothetical protein